MVEADNDYGSDEGDFEFDAADKEKETKEAKDKLAGIKNRQSYFVGKGGGTLSVMKREKNLNGEASEEVFQRGETTAADAIAQASQDESLKRYIASLGINNLDESATANVDSKGNPDETFVEFVKLEIVSAEHPAGCMPINFLKPDKDGVIQTEPCKVKEGTTVGFRVTMKVYNDTVLGLDFRGDLKYKDMKSV